MNPLIELNEQLHVKCSPNKRVAEGVRLGAADGGWWWIYAEAESQEVEQ